MRIKLLGTGGSEGIPAIFCNCPVCTTAKRKKGKEIRKRSSAIINGELMIDFPPDILSYLCDYSLDLTKIKYLFVTHSHSDHLCLDDLSQRNKYVSIGRKEEILNIFGNTNVVNLVKNAMANNGAGDSATYTCVSDNKFLRCGNYTIIPIKSKHMKTEESLVYIITENGSTIFYCTDTDILEEEQIKKIANSNVIIDCVFFDCTFGNVNNLPSNVTEGHLNINGVLEMVDMLTKYKIVNKTTKYVLTHIAHSGQLNHNQLVKLANQKGLIVGFDGLEIEV